jgi:hypothetical protein
MMAWVVAGLGLVVVAELWRVHRHLRHLTAQLAVLTVVVHDVLDKIVDLDAELHAVDERERLK